MIMFRFILLFVSISLSSLQADPLLIGYYSNWAQFRPEPGNFLPENITPILPKLTDIHYAYLFFNYNAETRFPTNDWKIQLTQFNDDENIKKVVQLAGSRNVYACVGGWDFNDPTQVYGSTTFPFFSEMVADTNKSTPFIQSAIALCQKYQLAGICLEWLFPGVPVRGGSSSDYNNFTAFIKNFSQQMTTNGFKVRLAVPGMAPPNYTSGTAIVSDPNLRVYNISVTNAQTYIDWLSALSQYVDLFYVMCYDYFGPKWQPGNGPDALPLTGENAPLQPNPTIAQVENNPTCIVQTVNAYKNNVQHADQPTPANKIVIGVPAYGRTFRGVRFPGNLIDQPHGPGAQFTEPEARGYYTQLVGFLSFYEIKYNLANYFTNAATNTVTQTGYAWNAKNDKNNLWVSYDNEETAKRKGEYIIDQQLRGGGVWTLDDDDFFDIQPFTITNRLAEGLGI